MVLNIIVSVMVVLFLRGTLSSVGSSGTPERLKRDYFISEEVPLQRAAVPQILVDFEPTSVAAQSADYDYSLGAYHPYPYASPGFDTFHRHHHHLIHDYPHQFHPIHHPKFFKHQSKTTSFGGGHPFGFHNGGGFHKTEFNTMHFGRNTEEAPSTLPAVEDTLDNTHSAEEHEARVASPTFGKYYYDMMKKNKKYPKDTTFYYFYPYQSFYHQHPTYYRTAEASNDFVESPYFMSKAPSLTHSLYKRIANNAATPRLKRSLIKLITDPTVKLDMPKTLENAGTITRQALSDERAPLYHLKQFLGSSKDAVLSTLKIPPQNLIIPSKYQIVRSRSRLGSDDSNENINEIPSRNTFEKLGGILKDSVQSGQATIEHLSDVAHNVRNIVTTTKGAMPRIILPGLQKLPTTVLVGPEITATKQNLLAGDNEDYNSNEMVEMEHLMDAVGVAGGRQTSESPSPRLRKLLLKSPRIISRGATLDSLDEARETVGATNLKEFFNRAKDEFVRILRGAFWYPPKEATTAMARANEQQEMERFLLNLFDEQSATPSVHNPTMTTGRMTMPPALYQPFMGAVPREQLNEFFLRNGDEFAVQDDVTFQDFMEFLQSRQSGLSSKSPDNSSDNSKEKIQQAESVVGDINPEVYQSTVHKPLVVHKQETLDPNLLFMGTMAPIQDQGKAFVQTQR